MENSKNNVLLTVLGVCTLLVALVGASFAYFTATSKVTNQNVKTGKLNVTSSFSQVGEENNIKPTTFVKADADSNTDIAKYSFNVKGDGTTVTEGTYTIQLVGEVTDIKTDDTKGGTISDVEYALYKVVDGGDDELIKTDNFSNLESDAKIATSISLSGTTDDNYILYVYIKDNGNQDNLQKATIKTTMNAYAQTPAPSAGA